MSRYLTHASTFASLNLNALSDLFDRVSRRRIRAIAGYGDSCPARAALDEGISDILGLPDLGKLRVLLASEPVVCNRTVVIFLRIKLHQAQSLSQMLTRFRPRVVTNTTNIEIKTNARNLGLDCFAEIQLKNTC